MPRADRHTWAACPAGAAEASVPELWGRSWGRGRWGAGGPLIREGPGRLRGISVVPRWLGGVCQAPQAPQAPPSPDKSEQQHMVSRAFVCQERAGMLWRSHPSACPTPAPVPSQGLSHPSACPIPAPVPSQGLSHPSACPIPGAEPQVQVLLGSLSCRAVRWSGQCQGRTLVSIPDTDDGRVGLLSDGGGS